MTLLDQIAALWGRLEPAGWGKLLAAHGFRPSRKAAPSELAAALSAPLTVDRRAPGFADFAADGDRAIEPGAPARSLLYYAMASPTVLTLPTGERLEAFPTPAEIEAVENYVFAARRWSLDDARAYAGRLAGPRDRPGGPPALAVAVFASEFRVGADTPHRRHADLCFARTGVTRVGTAGPHYDDALRGFVHHRDGDAPSVIRVAPVRYSAWLAVSLRGSAARSLPLDCNAMRDYARRYKPKIRKERYEEMFPPQLGDDEKRSFWVPFHKLFEGDECLSSGDRPLRLTVRLTANHVNEKLGRLAAYLKVPIPAEELKAPPFRETTGLAEWSAESELGSHLLVPVPHPHLAEPAVRAGRRFTIFVPPDTNPRLLAALKTPEIHGPRGKYREFPGYAHIRHEVRNGAVVDLNDAFPNPFELIDYLTAGNYHAVAYRDFSADGWVAADVPELAEQVPDRHAAYSLVSPPNFFPRVWQRRLMELTGDIDRNWYSPPLALSDVRVPVNVLLDGAGFDPADTTATAVVAMPAPLDGAAPGGGPASAAPSSARHNMLPDDAGGIFHPGWDVGLTYNNTFEHLTNSTLGAPFPEDVKLCAAISAYWPGVVPDAARLYPPIGPNPMPDGPLQVLPLLPTVIPMTDREIGLEDAPAWDGSSPPTLRRGEKESYVEYVSPTHGDYVSASLANRFSVVQTGKLDLAGYRARVLAMDRVYRELKVPVEPPPADLNTPDPRAVWLVWSFREAEPAELERTAFREDRSPVFKVSLFEHGRVEPVPDSKPFRFRVFLKNNVMRSFLVSEAQMVDVTTPTSDATRSRD